MAPKAAPTYRKFSPRAAGLFSYGQLWASDDHLLLVSSAFAVEKYRRFYFQDIEALIVRPTNRQRNWIIVHAILVVLLGGICGLFISRSGSAGGDSAGFAIFFGVCTVPFLIALLFQIILGPSCVAFLQLRTGLEKLKMINRLRRARVFRERLVGAMGAQAERTAISGTP